MFSGRKCPPIYNPSASLAHLLSVNFLSDEANKLRVFKWVSVLQAQLKPGEVLCSLIDGLDADDEELIYVYVAALLNGNPIRFLDPRAGPAEIQLWVAQSNAKTLVVDKEKILRGSVEELEL